MIYCSGYCVISNKLKVDPRSLNQVGKQLPGTGKCRDEPYEDSQVSSYLSRSAKCLIFFRDIRSTGVTIPLLKRYSMASVYAGQGFSIHLKRMGLWGLETKKPFAASLSQKCAQFQKEMAIK